MKLNQKQLRSIIKEVMDPEDLRGKLVECGNLLAETVSKMKYVLDHNTGELDNIMVAAVENIVAHIEDNEYIGTLHSNK